MARTLSYLLREREKLSCLKSTAAHLGTLGAGTRAVASRRGTAAQAPARRSAAPRVPRGRRSGCRRGGRARAGRVRVRVRFRVTRLGLWLVTGCRRGGRARAGRRAVSEAASEAVSKAGQAHTVTLNYLDSSTMPPCCPPKPLLTYYSNWLTASPGRRAPPRL